MDAAAFDQLWTHLEPQLRHSARRKGVTDDQAEDLLQEACLRLWVGIQKGRLSTEAAADLRWYAQAAVENARIDEWRKRNPRWRSLGQQIRLMLRSSPVFALWSVDGEELCGPAEWEGQKERPSPRRTDLLLGNQQAFRTEELRSEQYSQADLRNPRRLALLIAHFFHWVQTPVPVEELRQALADILCLEVSVTLSLSASRETDNGTSGTSFQDLLPDFRLGPEELALRRALLRHFGRFVQGGRMSRGQRSSVSLNLEREALLDHLELLPTELAAVLDTPAPEFIREVWLRLPFQDLQIAAFLGLPDGPSPAERRAASLKVTNCRMTAMRDAWPRWLGETGWGSEQAARSTQRAARQEG